MDHLREFWPLYLGIAVALFGYVLLVLLPQLRENDTKNRYQHAGEPRMLLQTSELEKDFWTRFEKEKMRYLDSKNRWATVQTPVIPWPINTAFEFEWFGQKYHRSTIGMSYGEYLIAAVRFYNEMKAIWDKETYTQFGMKEMMEKTRQQIPINPDNLWSNSNN